MKHQLIYSGKNTIKRQKRREKKKCELQWSDFGMEKSRFVCMMGWVEIHLGKIGL